MRTVSERVVRRMPLTTVVLGMIPSLGVGLPALTAAVDGPLGVVHGA